jgi:hypothetical protein
MRSAGFPCRNTGCDRTFHVARSDSMDALREASASRSAHEIADHEYHHVQLADLHPKPYSSSRPKPASSGDTDRSVTPGARRTDR